MSEQMQRVRERLGRGNVQRVALVDDAYDCPTGMDLKAWKHYRVNPLEIDLDANSAYEKLDALQQVDWLRSFLATSLELTVEVFGRVEAQTDLLRYQADIWFFDLYWDVGSVELDPDDVAERAAKLARQLLEQYGDGSEDLPIIVLMSSRASVLTEISGSFARKAEIPVGCFEVLPKPKVPNDDEEEREVVSEILQKMYEWLGNPELRRRCFFFTKAVRKAADHAKDELLLVLQEMAVNDYAYILKEGISDDGHPLGDYLLWLMEPLFVHHLHDNEMVKRARMALDEVSDVDGYLPLNFSRHYEKIHQCRIWKRTPELTTGDFTRKNGEVIEMTRLHQGDLLQLRDQPNTAWLVISPSCDLSFRQGKRDPDPYVTVYLMKGTVAPLETAGRGDRNEGTSTYFFPDGGRAELITWEPKRVTAIAYADIPKFVRGNGVRRLWCLRRKYVLELVHAWGSHVTRVGLPVTPPAPKVASVILHVRSGDEWIVRQSWSPGGVWRVERKKIRVSLYDRVARSLQEVEGLPDLSSNARRDLRELGGREFFVEANGALFWEGASEEMRGYWGRSWSGKEPGKKVKMFLCVYEAPSVFEDAEGGDPQ